MIDIVVNPGTYQPAPIELLERAADAALRTGSAAEGEVSITLLDDAEIQRLNADYLGKDRPTDVIAFTLSEGDEPLVGDVYLGYEQALRQAGEHGVVPDHELARLTVHGCLHVLGHDHPEGPERVESEMFALQESILRRLLDG